MERSESERDRILTQRIQQLERGMDFLMEAIAEPDLRTERESRLEQQLRDNGLEPWELPPDDTQGDK